MNNTLGNISLKDILAAVAWLAPILATIGTFVHGYLDVLPQWAVILLLTATGLLSIYSLERFRMKRRELRESTTPWFGMVPEGWKTVKCYPHAEVLWGIRRPVFYGITNLNAPPLESELQVTPEPRCLKPNCNTDLAQEAYYLYGWKWKCLNASLPGDGRRAFARRVSAP
jgi:hypothetical protein